MTLLQASTTDIITPHLADQAFTVVLLVAFAIWMIRRQTEQRKEYKELLAEQNKVIKEQQEKLEKYMVEDRRTMIDVIERNTRVMERIEDNLEKKQL